MKFLITLLIVSTIASAQGLSYGVRLGLGVNSFDQSYYDDNAGFNFVLGGMASLDLALVSVDAEFVINGVATDYRSYLNTDNDETVDIYELATYINVPITARLSVFPFLYVRGGIQYDLKLQGSYQIDGEEAADTSDNFGDGLSYVAGIGASLDLPAIPGLMVDLRAVIPTYDTITESPDPKLFGFGTRPTTKLTQYQLSVGILF